MPPHLNVVVMLEHPSKKCLALAYSVDFTKQGIANHDLLIIEPNEIADRISLTPLNRHYANGKSYFLCRSFVFMVIIDSATFTEFGIKYYIYRHYLPCCNDKPVANS